MNQLKSIMERSKYEITEVNRFTVHSDWNKYVAFFPYNRIYYVVDGYAVLKLKDRDLVLEPGKSYFIPAFRVVTAECPDRLDHFYVHFKTDSIINNIFEYYKPAYEVKAEGDERKLIETIFDNFRLDTPYSNLVTDGTFKLLFSRFFRDSNFDNVEISKFSPVLDYIDAHIREPIKIAELAGIMNLAPVYFISIFKDALGTTPLQYILSKKLQLAQSLLCQDSMSIKEIAFYLGFESEVYFSRLFRKKCGITPVGYRHGAKLEYRSDDGAPLISDKNEET